jgi:TonB family protein
MNTGDAAPHSFPELPPVESWGWKKLCLLILLAFAAHLGFIFLLGERKTAAPRAVTNVPVFHLADNSGDLARLTDPTLFALPHAADFAPGTWTRPPAVASPSFAYAAPPAFLPLNPASLGVAFSAFMRTNLFAVRPPSFKPEPQLAAPPLPAIESALPQSSSWHIAGGLVGRKMLNTISAPTVAWSDVLPPSRLQLLVDTDGHVLSAVLLDTSGDDAADQTALELARTLRFMPAEKLMFGQIIFNWHTVAATAP